MITLSTDTINKDDIDRLIDWLKTYPHLTKGPVTLDLEKKWSERLGRKHTVYVNSGSSANLLMIYTLIYTNRLRNDKVVVPGLAWSTDLSPVIQSGLTPIMCDCNLDNLSVSLDHLEEIFKRDKPAALILVSILGFSPDMDAVIHLCKEHDVILLEDACESMGTTYKGKELGSFGTVATFSLYFGHHISTIEGGLLSTDDDELHKMMVSLRSHGWDRDWDAETQAKVREKYRISKFQSNFSFYYPGFNLRATDLQAYIGLGQMDALDSIVEKRNQNFKQMHDRIKNDSWKVTPFAESMTSNFAYPLMHPNRDKIVENLPGMECRPLVAGSLTRQPVFTDRYGHQELPNCDKAHDEGFYVPNHHGLTKDNVDHIVNTVNNAIALS